MQPTTMVPPRKLRNRVREVREKRGLTFSKLAKNAGISKATLMYVERDNGKPVGSTVMLALGAALGVPLNELWYDEPDGVVPAGATNGSAKRKPS